MPKVTIEYNLPEEISEFNTALHGSNLVSVIWNLDQWLRHKYKREDVFTIYVEEIRDKITELLALEGLSFESNIF